MAPEVEPGTPQAAAKAWVEAVMDRGNLAAAWPLTDPTLRLVLAQDWVWNHRHELPGASLAPSIAHDTDWEGIAAGLAECPSSHPSWPRFARDVVGLWHRTWKGFGTRTWTILEQPEVLGLDLEVVTFVETGGQPPPLRPRHAAFARRFVMSHTPDGWKMAGIGDQLFRPGWPPTLGQEAAQP